MYQRFSEIRVILHGFGFARLKFAERKLKKEFGPGFTE